MAQNSILKYATAILDIYCWFCFLGLPILINLSGKLVMLLSLEKYLEKTKENLKNRSSQNRFKFYRQTQLLATIFNKEYQNLLIPTLMQGIYFISVFSLYTCIKLHGDIDMPGFLVFPILVVLSLCGVFILKIASAVLAQSEKCLQVAKLSSQGGVKRCLEKKKSRSMDKVKIKFGSTNYFDHQTPFNLFNHALNSCVSLMLFK